MFTANGLHENQVRKKISAHGLRLSPNPLQANRLQRFTAHGLQTLFTANGLHQNHDRKKSGVAVNVVKEISLI